MMAMMRAAAGGDAHARPAARLPGQPAAAPQADHLIPPGLQMGASLPLLTPVRGKRRRRPGMPIQQPKGRMLIYWGCGEHVGAGPADGRGFLQDAAGQGAAGDGRDGQHGACRQRADSAPGFGKLAERARQPAGARPADRCSARTRSQANYSPPIAFSLAAGQDFMPGLGLARSGHAAVGRAAADVAAGGAGDRLCAGDVRHQPEQDVIMWSSANRRQMAAMDYLAPGEVRRLVAAGAVLPPSTSNACFRPKSPRPRRPAW